MPTNTYLLTKAHSNLALVLSNSMIFIKDDNLTLNLCGSTNDTIAVFGKHDTVFLDIGATRNITVQDHGAGTYIFMRGAPVNLTIEDFQNDRTGILRVGYVYAAPTLTSDHHGGTLATFGVPGASIDFVGDKHVTASHTPGTNYVLRRVRGVRWTSYDGAISVSQRDGLAATRNRMGMRRCPRCACSYTPARALNWQAKP